MLNVKDNLYIVKVVIGLPAAFHRDVIAEGVESVAYGTRPIALGCELAKGYKISRLMPGS